MEKRVPDCFGKQSDSVCCYLCDDSKECRVEQTRLKFERIKKENLTEIKTNLNEMQTIINKISKGNQTDINDYYIIERTASSIYRTIVEQN